MPQPAASGQPGELTINVIPGVILSERHDRELDNFYSVHLTETLV